MDDEQETQTATQEEKEEAKGTKETASEGRGDSREAKHKIGPETPSMPAGREFAGFWIPLLLFLAPNPRRWRVGTIVHGKRLSSNDRKLHRLRGGRHDHDSRRM